MANVTGFPEEPIGRVRGLRAREINLPTLEFRSPELASFNYLMVREISTDYFP
jgi:hypothetical protein